MRTSITCGNNPYQGQVPTLASLPILSFVIKRSICFGHENPTALSCRFGPASPSQLARYVASSLMLLQIMLLKCSCQSENHVFLMILCNASIHRLSRTVTERHKALWNLLYSDTIQLYRNRMHFYIFSICKKGVS